MILLIMIHQADSAIEGRGFGGVVQPFAPLLALVLMPPAFAVFLWRGRVVRSLLAAAVGLVAIFFGVAVSVSHVVAAGPAGSDFTGVLSTIAGFVLLGLAFRIGFQGARRLTKAIAIPILLLLVINWVISPAITAGMATNAPRPSVPSASTLGITGAVDVTFPARDGVRLAAWYVPGSNGDAVILLHGSHTSRLEIVTHLRMLVAAGYTVLAYDARGHGTSDGATDTRGWTGDLDLGGAVDYLQQQPGVDPARIAALGLSIGAMDALRAAADGLPLRAVVADGAGGATYEDIAAIDSQSLVWPLALSGDWLGMRATELVSGVTEPASLASIVGNIHVPVLLIASTEPTELTHDQIYADRIGTNATLWYIPDVGHVQGLNVHPEEYTARVTAFLRSSLLPSP